MARGYWDPGWDPGDDEMAFMQDEARHGEVGYEPDERPDPQDIDFLYDGYERQHAKDMAMRRAEEERNALTQDQSKGQSE